jgi:prolyl oligopeptidase
MKALVMPLQTLIARRRLLTLAALCASALTTWAAPPAIPVEDVRDVLHGVTVKDPYRSLEDKERPATRQWMQAQGKLAEDTLASIPGRDAMAQRVQALAQSTGDSVYDFKRLPGDRIYYLKRPAGSSQYKLMMRTGLAGAEQVLVDPEVMAKATGVPHAINYFAPSWDGKTVAYGISAGGSENASLYLQDVATGKLIGQPIPRVPEDLVNWTPDSQHVTYNQIRQLPAGAPATETFLDSTVFMLKVGDDAAKARPLFGPLVNPELKLDRLDVAQVMFSPGSPYMLARTTDTTAPEGRLLVAPVAALNDAKITWQPISRFDDKITEVHLHGSTAYLRSYSSAPRGQLLALNLAQPDLKQAKVVVPQPAQGVLSTVSLARNGIIAEIKSGFTTRLVRYAFDGQGAGVPLANDLAGSASAVHDAAHSYNDVYFTLNSWTEPSRVMRVDAQGATSNTGLRQQAMPPGVPALQALEVTVPSHDGAPVPLAIVHKKGLVLDGSNPVLLIGYGAYGLSMESRFDARSLAWIEQGGVIALANPRGSGAYGDAWYRAGFKGTKPNTWKDGIACAQYLIEHKYGSPKTLGIWGTSAGGVFVGRSVTTAPELFAAAIFDVGLMDAVRMELTANGATNISEFGTVKDPQEFAGLLQMSTYHQVRDGVAYPAVLLIHGMNDPRVDVWQSAKAAARLQAATSSGKPVLLRLDGQAGHGMGSTAQQGISKQADIYSFLLWQFGKLGPAKP